MTFKLNHICSYVHDMDTTIAFYTKVLDAQITNQSIIKSSNSKCVYIQIDDQLIELIEPGMPNENTIYGLTHIAYETDDLDKAYKYLTDLGYVFHVTPRVAGTGNGRLAFFKDPNGVIVEILQRDKSMYREPIKSPLICSFDHYAVKSADLTAAHKLYHEHLGMSNLAHFVVGDNIREIMYLGSETSALEIVQSSAYTSQDNPHSHFCLRVNNISEACKEFEKRGVHFKENAITTTGIKIGLTSSLTDPEGIRIELVERPDLRDLEQHGYTYDTLETLKPFN